MKIDLACMTCVQTGEILKSRDSVQIEVELNDDGFYEAICQKGHKIVAAIQNPKYELLFDFGGLALLDGYARESVSSFAASLERFYEYYIKLAAIIKKIEKNESESLWKKVSKQSERQLGGFLYTYLLINKRSPQVFSEKLVQFRNNVIHNGQIPKTEAVIEFGDAVGKYIRTCVLELSAEHKESMMQEVGERLVSLGPRLGNTPIQTQTMSIPTMLSSTQSDPIDEFDLSAKLKELEVYRTYVYSDHRKKFDQDYRYEIYEKLFRNNS